MLRDTPVGQTDQLRIHPATPSQGLRHPTENLDSQSESKPHPALSLVVASFVSSFKIHSSDITKHNVGFSDNKYPIFFRLKTKSTKIRHLVESQKCFGFGVLENAARDNPLKFTGRGYSLLEQAFLLS